jgi:hypothetical protein
MGHHQKKPATPLAPTTGDGPNAEVLKRPSLLQYLGLVVWLAIPVPLFMKVGASTSPSRSTFLTLMTFTYFAWAFAGASPILRRTSRIRDAKYCRPEREIASWRCDATMLDEFYRAMKRRSWTWRFRPKYRLGAKGYIEFRFFPEGVHARRPGRYWAAALESGRMGEAAGTNRRRGRRWICRQSQRELQRDR